jgi:hypothetical protein
MLPAGAYHVSPSEEKSGARLSTMSSRRYASPPQMNRSSSHPEGGTRYARGTRESHNSQPNWKPLAVLEFQFSDPRSMITELMARPAGSDSLRQRAGTDEPAFSGVVCRTADRVAAHSAGKPTQNAHVESFNGTLRAECLDPDQGSVRNWKYQQLHRQAPRWDPPTELVTSFRSDETAIAAG